MQDNMKQALAIAVREARTELGLSRKNWLKLSIWIHALYLILKPDVVIQNLKSCIL